MAGVIGGISGLSGVGGVTGMAGTYSYDQFNYMPETVFVSNYGAVSASYSGGRITKVQYEALVKRYTDIMNKQWEKGVSAGLPQTVIVKTSAEVLKSQSLEDFTEGYNAAGSNVPMWIIAAAAILGIVLIIKD